MKSLAGLPYGCYNAPPKSPLQTGIFLSKKPEVLAHRCVLSWELPLDDGSGFARDYGPVSWRHQHWVTDACRVTRPQNPLPQMRQLWRVFPASEPPVGLAEAAAATISQFDLILPIPLPKLPYQCLSLEHSARNYRPYIAISELFPRDPPNTVGLHKWS